MRPRFCLAEQPHRAAQTAAAENLDGEILSEG
jgi:hypothetical protein